MDSPPAPVKPLFQFMPPSLLVICVFPLPFMLKFPLCLLLLLLVNVVYSEASVSLPRPRLCCAYVLSVSYGFLELYR